MILTILFIVFFVLWLISLPPAMNARMGAYTNGLAWICVGLLAWHVGLFTGVH
jgi:hypothetical protein